MSDDNKVKQYQEQPEAIRSGDCCPECGSLLQQTGRCTTCPTCGYNTGCDNIRSEMSTPNVLEQLETALLIAERLLRREKALLLYIKNCQARRDISKEELLILKDILEIMSSSK